MHYDYADEAVIQPITAGEARRRLRCAHARVATLVELCEELRAANKALRVRTVVTITGGTAKRPVVWMVCIDATGRPTIVDRHGWPTKRTLTTSFWAAYAQYVEGMR